MENLVPALRNTIPISLFNKGMAGKIFKSVKENGSKVVMKNNGTGMRSHVARELSCND